MNEKQYSFLPLGAIVSLPESGLSVAASELLLRDSLLLWVLHVIHNFLLDDFKEHSICITFYIRLWKNALESQEMILCFTNNTATKQQSSQ